MSDKKNIIIFSIIFLIASAILFLKTGSMFIDFSRESYIPFQMLQGKTLIKDIFLIYGTWGYIVNSIIYKINIPKQELILTDFINPNPQILHISKEALKQLKTLYRK